MLKIIKPIFSLFQSFQEQNDTYIKGRTVLTINWQNSNKFEKIEQELINSFSNIDTSFKLDYGNIENVKIFANNIEIDSINYTINLINGEGILYSNAANFGDNITIEFIPLNPVNITTPILNEVLIGSCVPNRDNEFQISTINIDPYQTIKFYTNGIYIVNSTPIIDTINKTIITDKWNFNYETGKGILKSGSALSNTLSQITIDYYYKIKLNHYEIYKIENGSNKYISYEEVINDPNVVIVNDNISSNNVSYIEELDSDENGINYMYYIFAVDSIDTHSICDNQLIETIPSIIQNFVLTIRSSNVTLFWDLLEESNVDGYNIFRCEGTILQKENLKKLNSVIITDNEFIDSSLNTETRKSPLEIEYPLESKKYVYVVEAVDKHTSWKLGIENESNETSENLISQLIPYENE